MTSVGTQLRTFLASTNAITGGTDALNEALTGGGDVQITFVKDDEIRHNDATYDSRTNTIKVSESMAKDALRSLRVLQEADMVDEHGEVTDPEGVKNSKDAAAAFVLDKVLEHEWGHRETEVSGAEDKIKVLAQRIYDGQWDGSDRGPVDQELVDAAVVGSGLETGSFAGKSDKDKGTAILAYMLNEYGSYLKQESALAKIDGVDSSEITHITTDAEGNPLDKRQAMRNMYLTYLGQPLEFGPHAGKRAALQASGEVSTRLDDNGAHDHPARRHRS